MTILIESLDQVDLPEVFRLLGPLPHRLWLDSAADRDCDRGRYSFLTADPVAWMRINVDQPDPWPMLRSACQSMAASAREHWNPRDEVPPFVGGLAGLIAYEAAWWIEPTLRQPSSDAVGIAFGLYDWTIALDHQRAQAWLISTGLDSQFHMDAGRARRRLTQVKKLLDKAPLSSERSRAPLQPNRMLAADDASTKPDSNFSEAAFQNAVQSVVDSIHAGQCFQVNLAQTLTTTTERTPDELYHALRQANPAPAAGFFDLGDRQVLSSSPEGFIRVRDRNVWTSPVKGTVARTGNDEIDQSLATQLLTSEKDRAENIMIVDLMRNDLSRVCDDETIDVPRICQIERYQSVQHLVSTVQGRLRVDMTIADLLAASFPGGSITGAPKVEAMRMIRQLEECDRGAYCGSLGYISLSGDADFNILIRTMTLQSNRLTLPVGGGITARSVPEHELAETWTKARSMLDAIDRTRPEPNAAFPKT
ncbi:MAG: anthranilate synthase component I family protein [Planctomycetota bacterium]